MSCVTLDNSLCFNRRLFMHHLAYVFTKVPPRISTRQFSEEIMIHISIRGSCTWTLYANALDQIFISQLMHACPWPHDCSENLRFRVVISFTKAVQDMPERNEWCLMGYK